MQRLTALGEISGLGRDNRKRIPVRKNLKRWILKEVQKGKCTRCKKSIKNMGVRPILHHKNLNPRDNRPENLVVICPNCHDKIHQKEKKVVKRTVNYLGQSQYRVVKKIEGRKRKKTRKKKPRKKSKRSRYDLEIPKIKIPTVKLPRLSSFRF